MIPFLTNNLASLYLVGVLMLISCKEQGKENTPSEKIDVHIVSNDDNELLRSQSTLKDPESRESFNYDLKNPFVELKLDYQLKEISGLDYLEDEDLLLANNDEKAKIFMINPQSGEITNDISFGNFGDFEGLEKVRDKYYVVKSNGVIHEMASDGAQLSTHTTRLNFSNNVEGLGFFEIENSLLLACKDDASLKKGNDLKGKAVYQFSLNSKSLLTEPFLLIKDRALLDWAQNKWGDITKKQKSRIKSFSPSGIAVHPLTESFYIISAKGDLLVVCNRQGEIEHVDLLKREIEQIEGICFSQNGTMYISSEGVTGAGKIFGFKMKP